MIDGGAKALAMKAADALRTVYSLAIELAGCFFNTGVSPKTVFCLPEVLESQ